MLKKKLSQEDLLNQIDAATIFQKYFGDFDFNKCYPSIFRKDYHPSTGFYQNRNGMIIYNDLSTSEKLGPIGFVAKLYNLNYGEAIEKIAKDFGIIEGKDESKRIKVKKYKPPIKRHRTYEVERGIWRQEELDYWKQFGITKEELVANNIFPCRKLTIDNYVIENPMNYLRFVYIIYGLDDEPYIKIYSPHDPVYKWMGSAPKTAVFGWKELEFKSDKLIITKSQKDRLLWKKYFPDVIAAQSETIGMIPEEVLSVIAEKYKPENVYINFDCDKAGIEGAKYYCETYGWKSISVPEIYYEKFKIKDFADLVKERGLDTFEKYLKWIKLIN